MPCRSAALLADERTAPRVDKTPPPLVLIGHISSLPPYEPDTPRPDEHLFEAVLVLKGRAGRVRDHQERRALKEHHLVW